MDQLTKSTLELFEKLLVSKQYSTLEWKTIRATESLI